jgi:D-arginine dehydrogenase
MHTQTRFLIIGGGVAGLATAWHLARLGHGSETLLLERERLLGARSSGQNAAILRTLGSDPLGTRLALASARFLAAPPNNFSDTPLLDPRGLILCAGESHATALDQMLEPVAAEVKHVRLNEAEVRAMQPLFASPISAACLFPDEGQIDIAALVAGFAKGARRGGVEIRTRAPVERLIDQGGRILGVQLEGGSVVRAETTILAAGGWAGRLGAAAGSAVRLRPTRRHLMVTRPDPRIDRAWPVLWHLGPDEFYCRPESGGMLLCACDLEDVDPDHDPSDARVREHIAETAIRHMPGLTTIRSGAFWAGVRTLSEDARFAIGADPDRSGLFWVAGLAGAGMVCSAEVGRIAAALLSGEPVESEVAAALSPARLATL